MKKIFILQLLLLINASIFGQELITDNPSFSKGLRSWQFGVASYDEDTPDAEFKIIEDGVDAGSSACKVKVKIHTQSDNFNDAYLMHRNIAIKKGKTYRVIFHIKSNTIEDKVLASIVSGTPPDLQRLDKRELKFTGDGEWKKISYTFLAKKNKPNVDFKDLSLIFGFNHRFGTFYIDEISIVQIP